MKGPKIHCRKCKRDFHFGKSLFTSGYLNKEAEKFMCFKCYKKATTKSRRLLGFGNTIENISITFYRHGKYFLIEKGKTRELDLDIGLSGRVKCNKHKFKEIKKEYKWGKRLITRYYKYCSNCGCLRQLKEDEVEDTIYIEEFTRLHEIHKGLIEDINYFLEDIKDNFQNRFKKLLWEYKNIKCHICNRPYKEKKSYVKNGGMLSFHDKHHEHPKQYTCGDCIGEEYLYDIEHIPGKKKKFKKKKWGSYKQYLLSDQWKYKRNLVIDRCHNKCEGCRESKVEVVHHLSYDNVYNEFLFELMGLCKDCHERFHKKGEYDEKAN